MNSVVVTTQQELNRLCLMAVPQSLIRQRETVVYPSIFLVLELVNFCCFPPGGGDILYIKIGNVLDIILENNSC